jgi:large subunit ribosomal protein L23
MAFNIFKKKSSSVPQSGTTAGKEETKKAVRKSVGVSALSLPHVTEKAGLLQGQNQYVFKVVSGATKYGVRDSVQAQYGVEVAKVRMITVPSKSIRVGKTMGKRPGYKKAVITLKEGYKIEMGA